MVKATVVVNIGKKFVFIYKTKSSQLCIFFHYGVWKKAGFPLHKLLKIVTNYSARHLYIRVVE